MTAWSRAAVGLSQWVGLACHGYTAGEAERSGKRDGEAFFEKVNDK